MNLYFNFLYVFEYKLRYKIICYHFVSLVIYIIYVRVHY